MGFLVSLHLLRLLFPCPRFVDLPGKCPRRHDVAVISEHVTDQGVEALECDQPFVDSLPQIFGRVLTVGFPLGLPNDGLLERLNFRSECLEEVRRQLVRNEHILQGCRVIDELLRRTDRSLILTAAGG